MDKQKFTLKSEHVLLLSNTWISWYAAEHGAPCIDPKRPYGNGDVYGDMAEILGMPKREEHEDDWVDFNDDQIAFMDRMHRELEIALQVILRTKSFELGEYEAGKYNANWRKVLDNEE